MSAAVHVFTDSTSVSKKTGARQRIFRTTTITVTFEEAGQVEDEPLIGDVFPSDELKEKALEDSLQAPAPKFKNCLSQFFKKRYQKKKTAFPNTPSLEEFCYFI